MRLFGQIADAVSAPEPKDLKRGEPDPPAKPPDFSALGEHVAQVLEAARESAAQIRADAERDAASIREEARTDAEVTHQAATERREESEREAQRLMQETEAKAEARLEAVERQLREAERASVARREEVRDEVLRLERKKEQVVWEVRELASQLHDILGEGPETTVDAGREAEPQAFNQFTATHDEAETVVEAPAAADDEDDETFVESVEVKRR